MAFLQELATSASLAQLAATEANEKLLRKLREEHAASGQALAKKHQAELQGLGRVHAEALQAAVRGQQKELEQLQRDNASLEIRLAASLSEEQVCAFFPSHGS